MIHVLLALAIQLPEAPKPGKHHEHLKALAGTWTYQAVFQMGSGSMAMSGTQTDTMSPDGLWLVIDSKGVDGSTFWGHGVVGFDSAKGKYVGVWVDSMADTLQISEGECSDDGKTQTVWSTVKDEKGKPAKMKHVTQLVDADNKTLTFYAVDDKGGETQVGSITYTRKK